MPGEKPPPRKPRKAPGPAWQVILEEMRSQNRITIEAVQGMRDELKRDIAELRENTNARSQVLESAVRQNSTDILNLQGEVRQNSADIVNLQGEVRQNSADIHELRADVRNLADEVAQNSADIRGLDERVGHLAGVEARVTALERKRG